MTDKRSAAPRPRSPHDRPGDLPRPEHPRRPHDPRRVPVDDELGPGPDEPGPGHPAGDEGGTGRDGNEAPRPEPKPRAPLPDLPRTAKRRPIVD